MNLVLPLLNWSRVKRKSLKDYRRTSKGHRMSYARLILFEKANA